MPYPRTSVVRAISSPLASSSRTIWTASSVVELAGQLASMPISCAGATAVTVSTLGRTDVGRLVEGVVEADPSGVVDEWSVGRRHGVRGALIIEVATAVTGADEDVG